ncbi:MAG: energy transducer TonB [Terriglobales bacterium]
MRRAGSLIVAMALCAGLFAWTGRAQAGEGPERKAVAKAPAVYPEVAKRYHIRGMVKLEVVVREDGSVKSTNVLGGNPVLIDAATDAVRRWRFEAASRETVEAVQVRFGD